jgi:hypothetical protein
MFVHNICNLDFDAKARVGALVIEDSFVHVVSASLEHNVSGVTHVEHKRFQTETGGRKKYDGG